MGTSFAVTIVQTIEGGVTLSSSAIECVLTENFFGPIDAQSLVFGNGVGVRIDGANNVVGGPNVADANIFTDNGSGILLNGGSCANNLIQNNTIGLTWDQTDGIPNGTGVYVRLAAADNVIRDNVICANSGNGILVDRLAGQSPIGTLIYGNHIGVSRVGGNAFPNHVGIFVDTAFQTTIGGTGAGEGNIIKFNKSHGIELRSNAVATIGNTIVENEGAGVTVHAGIANVIRLNSIYMNDALGIDLNDDGVTNNDDGDGDTGPNHLQNYPEIDSIRLKSTDLAYGTLNSTANSTFMLDFYVNANCDVSNFGEGQVWVDSLEVTTDAFGVTDFVADLTGAFAGGMNHLTVTATNSDSNTSEFSPCVLATSKIVDIVIDKTVDKDTVEVQDTVAYTLSVVNIGPDKAHIVTVLDTILPEMFYVDHSSTIGNCTFNNGVLRCIVPEMPAGGSGLINIRTVAVSPGDIMNRVYAAAVEPEAVPFDNRDSVMVHVRVKTSVSKDAVIPSMFVLRQNYPNPFNPGTSFSYDVPAVVGVRLAIYNMLGQAVRTLVDEIQPAGSYSVTWDGRDAAGRLVGAGVYLYQLSAGEYTEARKMLMLK